MASIVTRTNKSGISHHLYVYEGGKKRHLMTFDNREEAEAKKRELEERALLAKTGAQDVATAYSQLQTLRDYFYDEGPEGFRARKPRLAVNTWKGYESMMRNHVLPSLGHREVSKVTRRDVRALLKHLEDVKKLSPQMLAKCRKTISVVYKTLVQAEVVLVNPAHEIETPKVVKKEIPTPEPADVKRLLQCFPTEGARLFCIVLAFTGARYGEVAELRRSDVNFLDGAVTISRAVADVGDRFNPTRDGRFMVKDTKGGKVRYVNLGVQHRRELQAYADANNIGRNDLLFPIHLVVPLDQRPQTRRLKDDECELTEEFIETLGLTEPNDRGSQYRHGTLSGYTNGRCRCEFCRQAMRVYTRSRPKPKPKKTRASYVPRTNSTGHMPRDSWYPLWYQACQDAGIDEHVTPHSLRHACATMLIAGGLDLYKVQQQLGHASITTTEIYLHKLKGKDDQATNIMESFLG